MNPGGNARPCSFQALPAAPWAAFVFLSCPPPPPPFLAFMSKA